MASTNSRVKEGKDHVTTRQKSQSGAIKRRLFGANSRNPANSDDLKGVYLDPPIKITVRGPPHKEIKTVSIPPKLLFRRCPYFRRLLPTGTSSYRDLDLDVECMELFAIYCSHGTIPGFQGTREYGKADVLREMLNLWFLGEKLHEPPVQNLAINKAARAALKTNQPITVHASLVEEIYTRTAVDSPLRRYIVDLYCWSCTSSRPALLRKAVTETLPRDFLRDWLLVQGMKLGDGKGKIAHENPNLNPKKYHLPIEILDSDDEDNVIEGTTLHGEEKYDVREASQAAPRRRGVLDDMEGPATHFASPTLEPEHPKERQKGTQGNLEGSSTLSASPIERTSQPTPRKRRALGNIGRSRRHDESPFFVPEANSPSVQSLLL